MRETFLLRFAIEERAVSALEFALVLPLMLTLLFGAVEVGSALSVDRRTHTVASSMADLVGQSKAITTANMEDIFTLAAAILEPYNYADSKIVVSSVVEDNGSARVVWSDAKHTTPRAPNSTISQIPPGILTPGTSVIMAEVTFDYKIVGGRFMDQGVTLTDTFYVRPRRSTQVLRVP